MPEDGTGNDGASARLEKILEINGSLLSDGDHADAEGPLMAALCDEDTDVRIQASWGLGKLAQSGHREGTMVTPLVNALGDCDGEVAENAAWALGELAGDKIGSMEALHGLEALLSSPEAQTRGMAAWALGRLAERAGICRPQTLEALERSLPDASDYVVKGIEWAIPRVGDCLGKQ